MFEDLGSPYISQDIIGFTPYNLINRQYGFFEALRFFSSQIIIIRNRLISNLKSFQEWEENVETYTLVVSDAWFLAELYYQTWHLINNRIGFKKSVIKLPDNFAKFLPNIESFRNHRQHISGQIINRENNKSVTGFVVWYAGESQENFKMHLVSLEADERWLQKTFQPPRLVWTAPISSVSLIFSGNTLPLMEIAKCFEKVVSDLYKITMLSMAMKSLEGSPSSIKPSYLGRTMTASVMTFPDRQVQFFEDSSKFLVMADKEFEFIQEDLNYSVETEDLEGRLSVVFRPL